MDDNASQEAEQESTKQAKETSLRKSVEEIRSVELKRTIDLSFQSVSNSKKHLHKMKTNKNKLLWTTTKPTLSLVS